MEVLMGNTIIDSDEEALKRIAGSLSTAVNELENICTLTKKNIGEARPLMMDESGAKACDNIEENIKHIQKILPPMEEFSATCYEIVKHLLEAKNRIDGV